MRVNEYIDLSNKNSKFKFSYSGFLKDHALKDNSNVVLRVGDENWNKIKNIPMTIDENNNFTAKFDAYGYNVMNYCFNYNNIWDNNFSHNYSAVVPKREKKSKRAYSSIQLEDFLTDDFLHMYNIISKSDNKKYEESLNDLEIKLDDLFPRVQEYDEQYVSKYYTNNVFAYEVRTKMSFDTFSPSENTITAPVFIPITVDEKISVEKYYSKQSYRDKFAEILDSRKETVHVQPIRLIAKTPYINHLREITEYKNVLNVSSDVEESKFLVVSPYNELDIYNDSITDVFKKFYAILSKSLKKLNAYFKQVFYEEM